MATNKPQPTSSPSRLSPAVRVRILAVIVLLLGAAAGAFAAPGYWNAGANWLRDKASIPVPRFGASGFRLGLDLQGGSSLLYQADMAQVPSEERREALEGVRDVIERRVNAFGISEPLVQTSVSGDNYRVIVELAGIKDVNQAIKEIGETPILEFKEASLEPARELTAEEKKDMETFNAAQLAKAKDVLRQVLEKRGDPAAFGELAKQFSEDPSSKDKGGELSFFSRGTLGIEELEAVIFDRLKDGEVAGEPVLTPFGYHIIQRNASRETGEGEAKTQEVSVSHILFETKSQADYVPPEQWKGTGLTGKQLKRASVQFDPQSGQPTVALQFNDEGTKLFGEITERNVGKPVAIFLDGEVISSPVVNEPILGGQAVVSGNFTIQESKQLTQRLNAGALPVPVALVSQHTVGATLGETSLQQSLLAGLIGFFAVAVFMIGFYRFPGVLAVIALLIYTAVTLAIFKRMGVTMTLAAIAGFILSIGMAVDANVLIFERMKEEIRRGRSTGSAVDEGFRRAWLSIRDSNVSSLLTCAILYWLGTSVVRGFALTLAIGILVSMFSAITVTRTFMRLTMGTWAEKHLWLFGVKRLESKT